MSNPKPLFAKPVSLDSAAHRQLRYIGTHRYQFAAEQMAVPVMFTEAQLVARDCVLMFGAAANSLPLAIMGLSHGQNAYVGSTGQWLGRYVPAHLRRYPFILGEASSAAKDAEGAQASKRYVLIDADAPQLSADRGERLFNDGGEPAPMLLEVQRVLGNLELESDRTLKLVSLLDQAGVLVEHALEFGKAGSPGHAKLAGLRAVDFKRVQALPPEALHVLQQSGALELAYAHRLSLTNVADGVLASATPGVRAESSGSISFDSIDWSKF